MKFLLFLSLKIFLAFIILATILLIVMFYLPPFGATPEGERLARVQSSPNYKDGQFRNQTETPSITKHPTQKGVFRKFFFQDNPRIRPHSPLPYEKIDLTAFLPNEEAIVWMGHSSYLIRSAGKNILVDPVLSGYASPFSFALKSFDGTNPYTPEDIPHIDYLLITHDHYDHLDYQTITSIKSKVDTVITGLGVGAHFERWGYAPEKIIEKDWGEQVNLKDDLTVTLSPARHFSGRTFKRNQTLWTAFILETPTKKFYLGGDGGYDAHFKEVGEKEGPFDLAILENGQYNENWRYIHEMPEETVRAALDLKAKGLMPVHFGKFVLSVHDWDEPAVRVSLAAKDAGIPLLTPIIGSKTNLNEPILPNPWWEQIK